MMWLAIICELLRDAVRCAIGRHTPGKLDPEGYAHPPAWRGTTCQHCGRRFYVLNTSGLD